MGFDNVAVAIAKLNEIEATSAAYNHAMGILGVDGFTAAPAASWEGRGKTMEILSIVTYGLVTDPANRELLEYLLKPEELFERTCGKFDAEYFTDYLTKKYTELYAL